MVSAALELDGRTAGFGHDARGIAESLLGAFLVRAEGHVDDHQRLLQAASHGLTVHDHHLQRHAECRGQAVENHADAVADQHDIAMGIDQPGNRGGICRQADQRSLAFPQANIRRCDRLCITSCTQPMLPSLPLPAAGVAFGILLCRCEELKSPRRVVL
ncbi:hypothetical protein AJ88_28620 [Mesorhizobium amorphae CCBAU 01583]|nr:hypothetical protein AJ88_28620 [Mesorhizobium amorphae CCBAU 01583]